jgi:DNA-binding beta-propeller fold protein YncE
MVKLDPSGRVVASFGAGQIIWPHGMDVDAEGNIWVADARLANEREIEANPAARNHGSSVLKFSPDGELLMVIGTPGEMGDPPTHLTEPNDVLVAPNGRIYIGETHGAQFQDEPGPNSKSRITIWEPDGTYVGSFGEWGQEDGQFRAPHSLAMDSQGRLFVADRGNNRIQIFTQDGEHLDTWYQFSRNSGIFIDKHDVLYAADSESGSVNPDHGDWLRGIRIGSAVTGEVEFFIPDPDPDCRGTCTAEGVVADKHGNIFGAEVGPVGGVKRYVRGLE